MKNIKQVIKINNTDCETEVNEKLQDGWILLNVLNEGTNKAIDISYILGKETSDDSSSDLTLKSYSWDDVPPKFN